MLWGNPWGFNSPRPHHPSLPLAKPQLVALIRAKRFVKIIFNQLFPFNTVLNSPPQAGNLDCNAVLCLDEQKLKSKKSCELRFFKILLIVHSRIRSLTHFMCGCAAQPEGGKKIPRFGGLFNRC